MAFQITAALSVVIATIIVWRANKDIDTGDSLFLGLISTFMNVILTFIIALIICVGVVYSFSTPKANHNYRKLDTTNVTTTLTSGKKSITLSDQTTAKDLKGFSDGTISLSDGQTTAKRKVDDITLVNAKHGSTIGHIEYGKKTTYRDYFGSSFNEEKTTVMRVVFNSDELNKRFGD